MDKTMKTQRMALRVPDELREAMEKEAARRGITLSNLVRDALVKAFLRSRSAA